MIVRIATEGQYEIGDADASELHELDSAAIDACEVGDEAHFHETYARLLTFVREHGSEVAEDHLGGSDLILPPPDVTLDEAKNDLNGEGWIPEG